MKINNHVISIRIDSETLEVWNYLKKLKVNPARIFRNAVKGELGKVCEKYKFENKKIYYPF